MKAATSVVSNDVIVFGEAMQPQYWGCFIYYPPLWTAKRPDPKQQFWIKLKIFGFALPFEVIATIKNTESFLWLQFLRKELCMDWVVEVYLGNELIDDTSTLRLSDKANIPACETEAA